MTTTENVLRILIPTLTSTISINFLVLTFLVTRYEEYKGKDNYFEKIYGICTKIITTALVLTSISLAVGGGAIIGPKSLQSCLTILAVILYSSVVFLIVGSMVWLVYKTLEV